MDGSLEMSTAMLNMLAEKTVHQPLDPEDLAYCPTMDLIAVATWEGKVFLYRLNGQRVLGGVEKWQGSTRVHGLRWKPDGKLLAIAREDGKIHLVSVETGKVCHSLGCALSKQGHITCLGWGVNFTDSSAVQSRIEQSRSAISLDDILGRVAHDLTQDDIPDLPRDLALLDVDEMLPKLSVLPSGGRDEDLFGSRVSMDSVFHPLRKKEDDAVDVMVVGFSDGSLQVSIYDSFVIGTFQLGASVSSDGYRLLIHSSHPYCSTHTVITAATVDGKRKELSLVPLDMRFISNSGQYLSLLASKSTQLQNLLRYIHQTQSHIHSEWKSSQDLPKKFIRNINETLAEKSQGTLVQAAYHLVATGHCYPIVKEWLVDELAERGHKRWDKAVTNGYETIRRLTHENLLPALERCAVLVSRLNGLSKYQESNAKLGLSTQELENVLDAINCFNLSAHCILIHTNTELEQFTAFSKWLRHEIDVQATNSDGNPEEDNAERDPMIEHAKVLRYIQGAMTESRLTAFFDVPSSDSDRSQQKLSAYGGSAYESFKDKLKNCNAQSLSTSTLTLPVLEDLSAYLGDQCQVVFRRIAEVEKRNVRLGAPIVLERDHTSRVMDMKMLYQHVSGQEQSVNYVAVGSSESRNNMHIYRVVLKVSNGISSKIALERSSIHFGSGDLRDAKFVDNERIMVLYCSHGETKANVKDTGHSRLLSIPYNADLEDPFGLQYSPWSTSTAGDEGANSEPLLDLRDSEGMRHYLQHSFPPNETWTPERLEVNGRRGRRALCVLGADRIHYKIFDLDGGSSKEDASDEGMMED
ncbi:MAG: hypothetical protein M1812_002072 [Candelaria pacifica]|nr:MAG: hypothetical protein M1812_002072 [Candelaria pacifica]